MDTLTHALSGALLARAAVSRSPSPRQSRLTGPLLPWQAVLVGTVAGAFPDIDALAQLAGDLAYLRHHRGVTHSLLLAPLWALGLAALLRWLFASTRAAGGWKWLWPITFGGILIHIGGDWITQFGTMLLAPLSDARFGLGAVFIIDLTLSGLLLAGLALSAALPRRRWPAPVALLAAMGWVGVTWVGKQEAQQAGAQYARAQGIAAEWIETMPRPASPFNWTVTVFDGQRYHVAHVNTRRSQPLQLTGDDHFIRRFSAPYQPLAMAQWQRVERFGEPASQAFVRAAWEHEAFAIYRWFAQAPALAQVVEQAAPGGGRERCAIFRDLRFEFPGRGESPFQYGLCLDERGGGARLVRLADGVQQPV